MRTAGRNADNNNGGASISNDYLLLIIGIEPLDPSQDEELRGMNLDTAGINR